MCQAVLLTRVGLPTSYRGPPNAPTHLPASYFTTLRRSLEVITTFIDSAAPGAVVEEVLSCLSRTGRGVKLINASTRAEARHRHHHGINLHSVDGATLVAQPWRLGSKRFVNMLDHIVRVDKRVLFQISVRVQEEEWIPQRMDILAKSARLFSLVCQKAKRVYIMSKSFG